MPRSVAELEKIFGPASRGDTEEERALSSQKVFVRSQVQIAEDNARATGHRMSAHEAYRSYGPEILEQVADVGFAPIVTEANEPAATLKARRSKLNLTIPQVARASGLPVDAVTNAETPGKVSSIRVLEKIAQALALNDHLIGFQTGAGGDAKLGVRLREMSQNQDVQHFSANDVLSLADAAWVISTQSELSKALDEKDALALRTQFSPDPDYNYPAWERGYYLAERTRQLLGIGHIDPIGSIKNLVEKTLGIPVVQQQMADRFAGATLANEGDRGIVVNERGQNDNVWVRRMTIAHELGHLLWDPDTRLNHLKVDQYDDLQSDNQNERTHAGARRDPVEIRTNAFAISFLAPPSGILELVRRYNRADVLPRVMEYYGISFTAARHHVRNVANIEVPNVRGPNPSDEWVAAENMAIDWFPIADTPISRRGRFAALVASASKAGLISLDTASLYLRCSPEAAVEHSQTILEAIG